jgi:hypothetical protein
MLFNATRNHLTGRVDAVQYGIVLSSLILGACTSVDVQTIPASAKLIKIDKRGFVRTFTKYLSCYAMLVLLASCSVKQEDIDKIKSENDSLKIQLDELKNGENRLVAIIDKAYSDKDYSVAKANIELLSVKHPDSPKNANYKSMMAEILAIEAQERVAKEAAAKEQLRLANLNNTGMWTESFYVDDFGQQTKQRYIRNAEPIVGRFNNSATQGERCLSDR